MPQSAASPQHVEAWLRLALAPEIGPVLGHRLLRQFGSPEFIFAASSAELLEVPGLGPGRLARLLDGAPLRLAREEAARVAEAGASLIFFSDDDYPALLRGLPHPPLALWARGRLAPQDRLALAVVGPRQPSRYARLMTQTLCPSLAAHGITIVSGLAYGIDAEAHRAALDGGGRTLAVLGQGLGSPVYPPANAELAGRMVGEDRGALLSIFPMATEPSAGLFPQRNEIIAGLALGTLVIEAAPESGSLITARHAAANNRVVLACPGDANRRSARGSNRLLAEGASFAQTAEDVLAALAGEIRGGMQALEAEALDSPGPFAPEQAPPLVSAGAPPLMLKTTPAGELILKMLAEAGSLPGDAIMAQCAEQGAGLPDVMQALLDLELAGAICQLPGRFYALKAAAK